MKTRLDVYDWTVRRAMLLMGLLISTAVMFSFCASIPVLVAAACALVASLLLPCVRRIVPLFCVAVVLVGLLCGVSYRMRRITPVSGLDGCVDTLTGVVLDCPRDGNMYTVRVVDAEIVPPNTTLLLYCPDIAAPSLYDELTVTVECRALYDSQNHRRAEGIFLQALPTSFEEDCILIRASERVESATALRPFRSRMARDVTRLLTGDEGGLLMAVCFGDKSRLDDRVTAVFRASGLSHLLAVSGLHMSVIVGGIFALLRILRVKRFVGNIVAAVLILLFMWIVEFSPSVSRAGVMYLVMILGRMTRYQSDNLNSLGLALALIVLVSPCSVYDVGLWLSFLATVGVLCLTPRLYASMMRPFERIVPMLRSFIKWVVGSLSVSLGCTLPILPLMLTVFGEVSVVSPMANLLTMLPSGWMTMLGCVGSLLMTVPPIAFLGKGLILLAGLLAKWLIWVSGICSAISGSVFRPSSSWIVLFLTGAAVILCIAVVRVSFRRVCALLCVLLCTFIVALPLHTCLTEGMYRVALTTDSDGTVAVVAGDDGTFALMNDADSIYTLREMLYDLRFQELSLLVVNKCNSSDEAYLADFKREHAQLTIVCVEDVCDAAWCDYPIAVGERVCFGENCMLDIVDGNSWNLTVGESQLYLCLSRKDAPPSDFLERDAMLIYADSAADGKSFDADVVFCSVDRGAFCVKEADGLHLFSNDERIFIATVGDGRWKWMRRISDALV